MNVAGRWSCRSVAAAAAQRMPPSPASADPHAAFPVCPESKDLRDSNPYYWRACGRSRRIPRDSTRRPRVVPLPGPRTTFRRFCSLTGAVVPSASRRVGKACWPVTRSPAFRLFGRERDIGDDRQMVRIGPRLLVDPCLQYVAVRRNVNAVEPEDRQPRRECS